MNCPKCNENCIVTDSRPEPDCVRRKRKCVKCGYAYDTLELDADMWESMRNATKQIEERIRNNDGRR